jgi:leader peptidase (prepilin peptidase) / N-methyltransferase
MKFQMDIFEAIFSFLLGAVVGSFLNVVIIRLPQGASVAHPQSTCPECGHSIRFFDNIPIVSFLLLGGQCRDCGNRISLRYPIVELISACLCAALYFQWGLSAAFVLYLAFCSAMLAVFWIDLDHMIIPDVISLNGTAIGIVASFADLIPELNWRLSLVGACFGALVLYVPAFIYQKIRGLEGLGGGDIKLLAMIGAFTGPYGVIFVLFFSSLTGSVVALVGMLIKGSSSTTPIPFGPFLTSASIFYVFFGKGIISGVFGYSTLF